MDAALNLSVYDSPRGAQLSGRILDLHPAGLGTKLAEQAAFVVALRRGTPLTEEQKKLITPERSDIVTVYRELQARRWHAEDLQPLCAKLGEENTGKTLVAVTALEQVGLIATVEKGGAKYLELVPAQGKKEPCGCPDPENVWRECKMPEGKKAAVPAPKPVREEDLYSAKTHLHQPVPVQETATVSATAQLADAPEGALPSEVRPEIVTWEKLCEAIKASGRSYNMEMIKKAYDLANTAHKGVCRRSGEPYICHPLAVARLVLDLGMDSESIAAALLHDVVEDTPTTLDDLKAAFGEEVALLVDGVTKLTKIQFSNIEELQAENLRKMLLAMSRDVRVMIIKLCDRLHNMRTGDAWPEQKRRDKARETMEVYAPSPTVWES